MDEATTPRRDEATAPHRDPYAVALVRGGARAAVQTAALALHLRGAVKSARPGTLRATGAPVDPRAHPFERAVHGALHRTSSVRELLRRPGVLRAVGELRDDAVAAGLVRVLPPGRTRAGRRLLTDLRARLPLPATGPDGAPATAGRAVDDLVLMAAVHGDAALRAAAPRFVTRSGLLERRGPDDALLPHSWGGGDTDRVWHRLADDSDHGSDHGFGGGGGGGGSD
ncbi:hypothetical protein GCM10010358_55180 [Streptomyces minutiscleroticus]|uniref:TIGR04222 domain-containing membrane protein n=1 Tax=Streptomyces minutiscleroticus TaxID=68238 RepID=A0A918NT79_9ACTN|nr:TIGR04222 domain-containing membrane protein [Streptomyces minutiscleroticus]GGX94280.1 hypothetical protein GCM10010358_55180 [Streptomyces minutiscleroticus]